MESKSNHFDVPVDESLRLLHTLALSGSRSLSKTRMLTKSTSVICIHRIFRHSSNPLRVRVAEKRVRH